MNESTGSHGRNGNAGILIVFVFALLMQTKAQEIQTQEKPNLVQRGAIAPFLESFKVKF